LDSQVQDSSLTPKHLSLEEVSVHPAHKVLMEVDDDIEHIDLAQSKLFYKVGHLLVCK
jgi:hypothetical protein